MYEKLLDEAHEQGLTVIEKYPFTSPRIRGLCCDDTIALSAQIDTEAERTVILCEELAHATHSVGDILDDSRMERKTRERIFDRLVGLPGIVRAYLDGCREPWEFAEFFSVPEDFLKQAIQNYRQRYGTLVTIPCDDALFALCFEPTLSVRRLKRAPRNGRLKGTT